MGYSEKEKMKSSSRSNSFYSSRGRP